MALECGSEKYQVLGSLFGTAHGINLHVIFFFEKLAGALRIACKTEAESVVTYWCYYIEGEHTHE